jgi:hypothetical protein
MKWLKPASKADIIDDAAQWQVFLQKKSENVIAFKDALQTMFYSEVARFYLPTLAMCLAWAMTYALNDMSRDPRLADSFVSSPYTIGAMGCFAIFFTINRLIYGYRLVLNRALKNTQEIIDEKSRH